MPSEKQAASVLDTFNKMFSRLGYLEKDAGSRKSKSVKRKMKMEAKEKARVPPKAEPVAAPKAEPVAAPKAEPVAAPKAEPITLDLGSDPLAAPAAPAAAPSPGWTPMDAINPARKAVNEWLASVGVAASPLAQRGLSGIGAVETAKKLKARTDPGWTPERTQLELPFEGAAPVAASSNNTARNLGLGTIGAGSLGLYGGYRGVRSLIGGEEDEPVAKKQKKPVEFEEKEAQLGTPFTDGLLQYCLECGFNGEQVADVLEKGAQVGGWVGSECQGLMDRMVK